MIKAAHFSGDRVYRYALLRLWEPNKPKVMFIGLNPSTADEVDDDPTIRRCLDFAKGWGLSGIIMANLFALRATDPAIMKASAFPIGPQNDEYLEFYARMSDLVVACWGNHGKFLGRGNEVTNLPYLRGRLKCFGTNKDGSPKHPLYLSRKAALTGFKGEKE